MDYNEMRAMEKTHVCAMCGGELVTIWDAYNEVYRLCCGKDNTHDGFQQRLTTTQVIKRGKLDEVHGAGAQKDLEERAKRSETALSLLPKADVATRQALTIMQIGELVLWGEKIGLSAHLGHICLYHGNPYITIDGYYYLLDKQKLGMTIGVRPMSKEERKASNIGEGDYAWVAHAYQDWRELPGVGVGIVTREEIDKPSKQKVGEFNAPVVHNHPQRMAEKRAEWQLLRKLIPLEVKE